MQLVDACFRAMSTIHRYRVVSGRLVEIFNTYFCVVDHPCCDASSLCFECLPVVCKQNVSRRLNLCKYWNARGVIRGVLKRKMVSNWPSAFSASARSEQYSRTPSSKLQTTDLVLEFPTTRFRRLEIVVNCLKSKAEHLKSVIVRFVIQDPCTLVTPANRSSREPLDQFTERTKVRLA